MGGLEIERDGVGFGDGKGSGLGIALTILLGRSDALGMGGQYRERKRQLSLL